MHHERHQRRKTKARREQFADGSAIVTYPDGSMLILESELARESVLQESRQVNYNEPPPPRVAVAKSSRLVKAARQG